MRTSSWRRRTLRHTYPQNVTCTIGGGNIIILCKYSSVPSQENRTASKNAKTREREAGLKWYGHVAQYDLSDDSMK